MNTMPDTPTTQEAARRVMIVGLVIAALGLVAIIATFAATVTTMLLFGALLLLGGIALLVHAFRQRGEDFGFEAGAGALYSIAGLFLLIEPVSAAIGMTLLLAIFFIAIGVMRLVTAHRLSQRGQRVTGNVVLGALDLLLGVFVLAGWPETGTWVIGLFVGLELLFAGIVLAAIGHQARPSRRERVATQS